MKNLTAFLSKSALIVCLCSFLYLLFGSLIATGGKFWMSGGGATMFAYLPLLLFTYSFYSLEKNKSKYQLIFSISFWLVIALSSFYLKYHVFKMDHWPYGVAMIYLMLTLVSLIQIVLSTALIKKELKTRQPF